MQSTKTPTHGYSVGEVLRRGVPTQNEVRSNRPDKPTPEDPIEKLDHMYKLWLEASETADITKHYEQFFNYSEAIISDPQILARLDAIDAPHLMTALIGGDTELGLLELFSSWEHPPHSKGSTQLRLSAEKRLKRESRRIVQLEQNLLLTPLSDIAIQHALHTMKPSIASHETSAAAESIELAMQIVTQQIFEDLLDYKTGPPNRGIKDVTDKIEYLAQSTFFGYKAYLESTDTIEAGRLKGSILKAEALMVYWFACKTGKLKNAWPIPGSQRLHYGHYRYDGDTGKMNTDLVCMFPANNLAIPIKVNSSPVKKIGEARELVVVHGSDLYTSSLDPTVFGRELGAVTLGFLKEPDGASSAYLDTRAKFMADKIINLMQAVEARDSPWYISSANTATLPRPVLKF